LFAQLEPPTLEDVPDVELVPDSDAELAPGKPVA